MGVADSSSPDPQNTPVQIFTIDTRVRTLLARAMTTIGTTTFSMPASTSASLATKPENGGMPARLSAGSANNTASSG